MTNPPSSVHPSCHQLLTRPTPSPWQGATDQWHPPSLRKPRRQSPVPTWAVLSNCHLFQNEGCGWTAAEPDLVTGQACSSLNQETSWKSALKFPISNRIGGRMINTNCSAVRTRQALCCKMSVEYDKFIESGRK